MNDLSIAWPPPPFIVADEAAPPFQQLCDDIDPRQAFLARAAARLMLVEVGEMTLDEAISDLVPAFEELRGDGFDDLVERLARENKGKWTRASTRYRSTPAVVIDAIMVCVIERGPAALREPKNVDRMRRCDGRAKQEINARVAKLRGAA